VAYEANDISTFVDDGDLVFQLEVPAETSTAYWLPPQQWEFAIRTFIDLVHQIEPRAPLGIHLCFSDLNNRAAVDATSLDPLVAITNAMLERWPATHTLEYVHVPLAAGSQPPPLDRAWYTPLRELYIPTTARVVAGFVHERRTLDEHRQIRDDLDKILGAPVDIASSCGLGRRDRDTGDALLDITAQLVRD
jgi:hypothetical protein